MCGCRRNLVAMQLSGEDIDEFMDLYEKEFGERLLKDEASEVARNFAGLYELLAEPLPSESDKARPLAGEADSSSPS